MKPRVVQVFEHCRLAIDEGGFKESHFNQLVRYNEQHGNRFFDVGHRKIRFKSHVGVIQVGDLVIEVLPKADAAAAPDETKWRNALLEMLRVCRFIKLKSLTNAHLRLRSASLVDLYLETFLAEVGSLVRHGLVKRYRSKEANLSALKGRLLFRQQLNLNLVHKERFYTRYLTYNRDNTFNQILRTALRVLERVAGSHLLARTRQMLVNFEEINDSIVTEESFERIRFGRNTERYRVALQLARLIILNYAPDLRGGRSDVLAILFNMNELFEEYVFRRLQQAARYREDLEVSRQRSHVFWQSDTGRRMIRPDIILDRIDEGVKERVVIDTKWKVLRDPRPSVEDLRQMYAYHLQFEAAKTLLLYPRAHDLPHVSGVYRTSRWIVSDSEQRCALHFIDLFGQDDRLDSDLGTSIIDSARGCVC